MTITANRATLTEAEREQAREDLNWDERIFYAAGIDEALDQLATEIARIRMIAEKVPAEYSNAEKALALVEAVGRQYKPRGKVASIMNLIALVQDSAVRQARVHGATWDEIADLLGETRPNLIARFKD
jgi:hypothetical protein